jgi:hypothetical protein
MGEARRVGARAPALLPSAVTRSGRAAVPGSALPRRPGAQAESASGWLLPAPLDRERTPLHVPPSPLRRFLAGRCRRSPRHRHVRPRAQPGDKAVAATPGPSASRSPISPVTYRSAARQRPWRSTSGRTRRRRSGTVWKRFARTDNDESGLGTTANETSTWKRPTGRRRPIGDLAVGPRLTTCPRHGPPVRRVARERRFRTRQRARTATTSRGHNRPAFARR